MANEGVVKVGSFAPFWLISAPFALGFFVWLLIFAVKSAIISSILKRVFHKISVLK